MSSRNGGSDSERCEEHGKELNLFCREPGCQMHICVSCFEQHTEAMTLRIFYKISKVTFFMKWTI